MFTADQKELIDRLSKIDDINGKLESLLEETRRTLADIKVVEASVDKIIKEKSIGFPWLSDAISQYYELRDLKIAEYLEKKLHPALTTAQRVKDMAAEKRNLRKQFLIARNLLKYYEALFPWLSEFVGEDIDELLIQAVNKGKDDEQETDPVKFYLTKGEYEQLSEAERNQRALDRYWSKRKAPWQIGRDYERYIGYLYEQRGYSVYYQGIVLGFEDLGRDLICKKQDEVEIVQCKNWREDKIIHEKHINQLFGTTVEYFIKNVHSHGKVQLDLFPKLLIGKYIRATIVTSASLSDTARNFAEILKVNVQERFPFKKYPSIKCNVSYRDKNKIYHLPFDQQYDRTFIEEERNERYVATVKEAESLGFRRAFRWKGGIGKS